MSTGSLVLGLIIGLFFGIAACIAFLAWATDGDW